MTSIAFRYHLFLYQPQVVFRAQVNQSSFTRNAAQVTYDNVTVGSYTDIEPEMLILFGSSIGDDDYGRARVRKAATSDTLYFGWASRSKGEGEAYLEDDAFITVLDLYKPWTKNPRITDSGVIYTDYDRDYPTYGKNPPVIVLGCGIAVHRPLDNVTNLATFSFDASASYVTDYDASTISTWAWELPAGASVISGGITQDNVTFTIAEGAYWISVTATDDEGTSMTRRVLCVAGEPDGTITAFDNLEITRRVEGQVLRVRLSESVPESTYPNGTIALLWRDQIEDGVVANKGSGWDHVVFTGWHYSDSFDGQAKTEGFMESSEFEFHDLGRWLMNLPGYHLIIERKSTTAYRWVKMKGANIDRYFIRILGEYSNALNLADFTWSGLGNLYYPFSTLASEGQTLYDQVDGRAQAIAYKFTCDQYGRLWIKRDSQLLDPPGGTGTPITRTTEVQANITTADWTSFRSTYLPFPRTNWNWGSAIVASTTDAHLVTKIDTVFCVAPGRAPSQGTSTQTSGEQLVTDQDELNAREGHRYAARMNNPLPSISVELTSPDDQNINPAYMSWITFTNSATTAGQRGRLFNATRFLPIEVLISYDGETGFQTVEITAEQEVIGTPAQTYVPPTTDYGDIEDYEFPDEYVDPGDYDLGPGLEKIFLIHASGEVSYTSDFQTPSVAGGPTYTVDDLSLDGTVLGAVGDPWSPLFMGTGTAVNCWIVTTTRIYYVENICNAASRTITSQHTFTAETSYRTIQMERGVQDWLIVASYYDGVGVKACYTTDGGTTWTEVLVSGGTWASAADYWENEATFDFNIYSPNTTTYHDVEATNAYLANMIAVVIDSEGNSASNGQGHWTEAGSGPYGTLLAQYTTPGNYTVNKGIYANAEGEQYLIDNYPSLSRDSGLTASALTDGYMYVRITGNNVWVWANGTITQIFKSADVPPPGTEGDPTPTIHVSGKVSGQAYIGAISGSAGQLYITTDYGATWALATVPADQFGESLGGSFHVPWHDNPSDYLYYFGNYDSTTETWKAYRCEIDGETLTDITPAAGMGPRDPRCWSTCAQDRNTIILMARDSSDNVIGYKSLDGGDTWTAITTSVLRSSAYVGTHITDDVDHIYLWGPAGVAYSSDGGDSFDSRLGNASTSEVILIGGW